MSKKRKNLHPIAYQLAAARKAAGFPTQYALAIASGIPESTIRAVESAPPEAPPTIPTIDRICEAIGWQVSIVISKGDCG